jgi:hypothetical protein
MRRVIPSPLALFSTMETAQAHMRRACARDSVRHRYRVGPWYRVSIVPFDLPETIYRTMLDEFDWSQSAFVGPVYPDCERPWIPDNAWQAQCERDMDFDLNGEPFELANIDDANSPGGNVHKGIPKYRAGDLARVELGRNGRPSRSCPAVIRLINTETRGMVPEFRENDVFEGSYPIVYFDDYTAVPTWSFECDLYPPESPLPVEAAILGLLSRHFKGEIALPADELERFLYEIPFASGVEVFDFEQYGPIASVFEPVSFDDHVAVKYGAVSHGDNRLSGDSDSGDSTEGIVYLVLSAHVDTVDLESNAIPMWPDTDATAAFSTKSAARRFLDVALTRARLDLEPPSDEDCARTPCLEASRGAQGDQMREETRNQQRFHICELMLDSELLLESVSSAFDPGRGPLRRSWCYNGDGTLLWSMPSPQDCQPDNELFDFEGKYTVGALVWVIPQARNPESESILGDYGVIASVPLWKDAWLKAGKNPADWKGCYLVHYVHPSGYLCHYEVPESCLAQVTTTLPERFAFLPIWSKVLRGEILLPGNQMQRILERKTYLFDEKPFQFSGYSYA